MKCDLLALDPSLRLDMLNILVLYALESLVPSRDGFLVMFLLGTVLTFCMLVISIQRITFWQNVLRQKENDSLILESLSEEIQNSTERDIDDVAYWVRFYAYPPSEHAEILNQLNNKLVGLVQGAS